MRNGVQSQEHTPCNHKCTRHAIPSTLDSLETCGNLVVQFQVHTLPPNSDSAPPPSSPPPPSHPPAWCARRAPPACPARGRAGSAPRSRPARPCPAVGGWELKQLVVGGKCDGRGRESTAGPDRCAVRCSGGGGRAGTMRACAGAGPGCRSSTATGPVLQGQRRAVAVHAPWTCNQEAATMLQGRTAGMSLAWPTGFPPLPNSHVLSCTVCCAVPCHAVPCRASPGVPCHAVCSAVMRCAVSCRAMLFAVL